MLQSEVQESQIEIFISGRRLRDLDVFSKSDPYVIFLLKNQMSQKWVSQGRTETIDNCLNPNFMKSFKTKFQFETKQECRFEVYDDDGLDSESIGHVETTIGKLMGAKQQTSILDLHIQNQNVNCGKLIIRCDNIKESNKVLQMQWSGLKLMNTDGWFGTSDPFLRFLKVRDDKSTQKIFESEVIMNNLNPQWKPCIIPFGSLCDGDVNRKFKIEVWDWENNQKFQFIGEIFLSFQELQNGNKEFKLFNAKYSKAGSLKLGSCQLIIQPTFLDYIRGGMQINQMVAIDFTGSNGNPNQPSSLHYMNPQSYNQYQQAIMSVGEILIAYDFDKLIPSYGFGANTYYPTLHSSQVLHCFPLSGNPQQTECLGIPQLLEMYNYAIRNVHFSGPTYFGPIISESVKLAQQLKSQEQDVYTVLLILTDGEIHDMEQTKDLIVSAATLPLSIIIVGIGQADFTNMEILDGDSGISNSKGQKSRRDLVQFVPFRQFNGNNVLLAQQVLAEIPAQVVQYHQLIGKKPNPPLMVDIQQLGNSVNPPLNPQNPYPQNQVLTPLQPIQPSVIPKSQNEFQKQQTFQQGVPPQQLTSPPQQQYNIQQGPPPQQIIPSPYTIQHQQTLQQQQPFLPTQQIYPPQMPTSSQAYGLQPQQIPPQQGYQPQQSFQWGMSQNLNLQQLPQINQQPNIGYMAHSTNTNLQQGGGYQYPLQSQFQQQQNLGNPMLGPGPQQQQQP